jgi:hypothetical protein
MQVTTSPTLNCPIAPLHANPGEPTVTTQILFD